jgi:hypothetical protein
MQASVDRPAEAGGDVAISMGEGIGEDGGDRVGGIVDDARVALRRVTKQVVVIGQETIPSGPDPIRVVERARARPAPGPLPSGP